MANSGKGTPGRDSDIERAPVEMDADCASIHPGILAERNDARFHYLRAGDAVEARVVSCEELKAARERIDSFGRIPSVRPALSPGSAACRRSSTIRRSMSKRSFGAEAIDPVAIGKSGRKISAAPPGNRLEALRGDRLGKHSGRVKEKPDYHHALVNFLRTPLATAEHFMYKMEHGINTPGKPMAKRNQVQFQKAMSLSAFLRDYGTEEKCPEALAKLRRPSGFECPSCGCARHCRLECRDLRQCAKCGRQTSTAAGTLFEHAKLPLATWSQAIFLITQGKKGVSAMDPVRKIMQAMMEREDEKPLAGLVQVDDVYLGGVREGRRGRGAEGKTPFVAAPETTEEWLPYKIKLRTVAGFRLKAIESWCRRNIAPGSRVYSDGLSCFGTVATAGCLHTPIAAGGGKASVRAKEFAWPDTVIGNAETALRSTHHSMGGKRAQRYLSEFEYRFNLRYDLPSMVPRLARAAARTPPISEKLLRKGAGWRLEG